MAREIFGLVAMDIEIEIFLGERFVTAVLEKIRQRLVNEILQIGVALSDSYCGSSAKDFFILDFRSGKFEAPAFGRFQKTNAGLDLIL